MYYSNTYVIKQTGASITFNTGSVSCDNIASFTLTSPLYLGNMSQNGSPIGVGTKGRLYYAKIYSGTSLVADLIPVKKTDGTICLYDKVRDKYFYNKGNGTITG